MNYPSVDKQAYAMFKAVKQFRPYILKNRTKVIVPHPAVRSLFVQKELGERRGNWMTSLQEYDLEFKPATIVKGQGLCKLMERVKKMEITVGIMKLSYTWWMYVLYSQLQTPGIEI